MSVRPVAGLAAGLFALSAAPGGGWWDGAWAYRRPLAVTLPPGAKEGVAWVEIETPEPLPADGRDIRVVGPGAETLPVQVLRAGPGSLASFVFEARPGPLHAYFGNPRAGPPPAWEPPAGVILETWERPDGGADSWNEARRLFERAPRSYGRTLRPRIFDGANPLGPSTDFLSRYRAVVRIPEPGRFGFATVSDDASFVFVDGRRICEWPGWHGAGGGLHGERRGSIDLGAGPHRIEYFHVQGDGESVAELAWFRPGRDRPEVVPPEAFEPVLAARAGGLEGPAGPVPDDFSWSVGGHLSDGEAAVVAVSFRARDGAGDRDLRWDFGDGTADAGRSPVHVFLAEGLYRVSLAARPPAGPARETVRQVEVHRQWTQIHEAPEERREFFRRAVGERDLSKASGRELENVFRLARGYRRDALAAAAVVAALRRPDAVPAERRFRFFYEGGFLLQERPGRDEAAADAFRRAADSAPDARARALAALHLGGLLLHAKGDAAGAARILGGIPPPDLPGEDGRLLAIYRGDAAALRGDRKAAEAAYRDAGAGGPREGVGDGIRRLARIQAAGDYLRRGEYDAALEAIRGVEWEDPSERLRPDTGLLAAEVQLGRGDLPRAEAALRRILAVNGDTPRTPEILLLLARVLDRAGRGKEAAAARDNIRTRFPYSEEAARAGPSGR